MTRNRYALALEALVQEYRETAATRRKVTPGDPGADALDYAAARAEEKVRTLDQPTAMLTPAQWAAEQERPVDESTVRRWCARGELDCERDGKTYWIPAGARRQVLSVSPAPVALERAS